MNELINKILILLKTYREVGVEDAIDWQKYNHYSIVHHSTSIEGASLTEIETITLLEEDLTAKGKPLGDHLMQKDHYAALLYTLAAAERKQKVSIDFLKEVSALIMKHTGSFHETINGSFDVSRGDLRLLNVTAGVTRFVDFKKVPVLLSKFCDDLNAKLISISSEKDALISSFDAHFNLVTIHPFADGNGRLSRLIMNFIQHYFDLPLSNIFKEDKVAYYNALVETRETENIDCFRRLMAEQYIKFLTQEIEKVNASENSSEKPNKSSDLGMSTLFL